ncbi:MAG TPA: HlyD family efflux transporter periplasmic adaptor subunit [Bryobacteraceae bacterium]|nr:HlyD family efflux transporter periplasmic adaptor subunit [Bryobacteraceae bacterium]
MDFPRKDVTKRRVIRRLVIGTIVVGAISVTTAVTSRLKPAPPTVDKATVWIDTVKRGEMLREVRGLGTLVPEELFHVPAPSDGRVAAIPGLAGTLVSEDTVLIELRNPDLQQAALDAEWNLQAAESDLLNLKAQSHSARLSQRSGLASLEAQYRNAKAKGDRDEVLYKQGLMLELDYRLSKSAVEELANQLAIEKERGQALGESLDAQLASKETAIRQLRAIVQLKHEQVNNLKVLAGASGVLQQVLVQVGQRVAPGADLAIVVQPRKLKAELKIPETQAKDVEIGQLVNIDTRNGVMPGRVSRIDPSVLNGSVDIDVRLTGPLPPGARPDLSIDGTIEIERLNDILFTGRPVTASAGSAISLFKVAVDGKEATRVKVRLGRTSVNTVEIIEGLKVGDRVILSDMSSSDAYDRIRLN